MINLDRLLNYWLQAKEQNETWQQDLIFSSGLGLLGCWNALSFMRVLTLNLIFYHKILSQYLIILSTPFYLWVPILFYQQALFQKPKCFNFYIKIQITNSITVMKNKVQDLVVCNHFRLVRKLGTGAFGQIYLAENKNNPSEKYAAKLQQANTKFPQLYFEAKMYKYLNASNNVTGIPKVHAVTTEGQYNVMLMDLLGSSVQDIFVDNNKIMSLKSALMIGLQMLERIQFLHQKQIIHRDIKPDNFLLGINSNAYLLYIVDFGLSKKYIKESKHIPYKEGKQLTGTARYASINTHMGIQQSRRDDIESIGYVIMYLLRGILPWQNMKAKDTKTKYKMIMEKKLATPAEVLCKGYPNQLAIFINYARNMKFQEKPDYSYLKKLINDAMKTNKIEMDFAYDWSKKVGKKIETREVSPLKQEFKKEVKEEKKKEDVREKTNILVPPTKTNIQRTKVSNNGLQKSTNLNNKNIQQVMGERVIGPKISTIKK